MRHALRRLRALPGIAVSAAGLVLLTRYRPGLPDLPDSLSSPLTTFQLQQLVLVAAWLSTGLLALVVLLRSLAALVAPAPAPEPPRGLYARAPRRRAIADVGTTGSFEPAFPPPFPLIPRGGSRRIGEDRSPQAVRDRERPPERGKPRPSIALLGPIEITPVEPGSRGVRSRTQQLLVYLALHPTGATSEELAAAALPGVPDDRARQRVWRAVSELRAELGDVVPRTGNRYLLDRTAVAIDVDEFDFLVAQARAERGDVRERLLERAVALVRGRPLSGADYAWATGEAGNLCARVVDALRALGELRLARDDPAGALAAAERALTFDTDNESAQRLAMRAESALGLREPVVKRYERLSRRLVRRYGLDPEQETRLLYRQLLSQDAGPSAPEGDLQPGSSAERLSVRPRA
jgi:DNA-binding SARP family transcriptional activator